MVADLEPGGVRRVGLVQVLVDPLVAGLGESLADRLLEDDLLADQERPQVAFLDVHLLGVDPQRAGVVVAQELVDVGDLRGGGLDLGALGFDLLLLVSGQAKRLGKGARGRRLDFVAAGLTDRRDDVVRDPTLKRLCLRLAASQDQRVEARLVNEVQEVLRPALGTDEGSRDQLNLVIVEGSNGV